MGSFFIAVFSNIFSSCRKHRVLTTVLIVGVIAAIILGVVGGIQLNNSMFPQDFSNVSYVKFLKGSTGFAGFFFSSIFTIMVFCLIIYLCCCKSFLSPLGILFFLYFVYTQTITIISVSTEFGFFNTLILVIYLIVSSLVYFILFLLFVVCCCDCCGHMYFSTALKTVLPLLLCFVVVILINVLFLMTLKNFVIILVYD